MNLGIFTVNQNNHIVSMNPATLKYSKKEKGVALWYPEGCLKLNDIVVLKQSNELSVFLHENDELIPIKRTLSKVTANNEDILDIYFAENHIEIFSQNGSLQVFINNCGHIFKENTSDFLLAADEEGLVYFSTEKTSISEMHLILQGTPFSAYISEDLSPALSEFFDADVTNALTNLKSQQIDYICKAGKMLALQKIDTFQISKQITVYTIGDEDDYLYEVKEDTLIYDQLYFNRDIKVNHNELSCEVRLRGYDKEITALNNKISRVCRKNVTIILTGESGTGKTRLARLIHKNSRRSSGPFVNVNCASISYNLIESELFGYEEGAFTGAKKGGKIGYFELAKGGTLFLDEISELPLKLQGKLLEVLQEGTFYRVGGIKKFTADVRLIVATNRNLEKMVKENKFREDLYYRINVFPIHLPPLRDRLNDLYSIIDDTLPDICQRLEIEPLLLTNQALRKMQSYNWPGNIRELENVLEKAAVMADENFIREEDIILENSIAGFTQKHTLRERMQEYEEEIVSQAYEKFNGDRKQMAEYLGISKTNLFEKIHKYNLE